MAVTQCRYDGCEQRRLSSCDELRDIADFIERGCADGGYLYLGKFQLGTVYVLISLSLLSLLAPVLYWYRWRRLELENNPSVSVANLRNDFSEPDNSDELWSKCLVAERGDKERAKYVYVEAVADETEKRTAIPIGKRAGFIILQFILAGIAFGLVRDLVGSGQYFVSGFSGLAILYFATSK